MLLFKLSPVRISTFILISLLAFELGCSRASVPDKFLQTGSPSGTLSLDAESLLHLDSSSRLDFGALVAGTGGELSIGLINGGDKTVSKIKATLDSASFEFLGGSFPGTGGNCPDDIKPGERCSVKLRFIPATGTPHSTVTANLSVSYNVGSAQKSSFFEDYSSEPRSLSLQLSGQVITPALLAIAPTPGPFGSTTVGATTTKTFTLTNSGEAPATGIALSGLAAPFSRNSGAEITPCGATLAAAASCQIALDFAPASAVAVSGSLTVDYQDGASAQTYSLALDGTGLTPAALTFAPPSVSFGTKANGGNFTSAITVSNSGQSAATGIVTSGLLAPLTIDPAVGVTPCGATMAGGASCTLTVRFAPLATSTNNQTLSVGYQNGATVITATVQVAGASLPPAALAIAPGALFDFGDRAVGSQTDQTFTLTNTGGLDAT